MSNIDKISNNKIEEFKHEILLGIDNNNEAHVLELHVDPNMNRYENVHFGISGNSYDLSNTFTAEQGEEQAKESLLDGELWRMAVADEQTESSLKDWAEDVINIDGWEHTLGDVYDIGNNLYCSGGGGGQIIDSVSNFNNFTKVLISKEDHAIIIKAWKELHLKSVAKFTKNQNKLYELVKKTFMKYPSFDYEQLGELINDDLVKDDQNE